MRASLLLALLAASATCTLAQNGEGLPARERGVASEPGWCSDPIEQIASGSRHAWAMLRASAAGAAGRSA